MLENSRHDTGRFSGLDQKRSGAELTYTKPTEEWDEVAEIMMINFSESGHPVFRGSSAFDRGDFKSKVKGRSIIHFKGSDETIEVILRAVISVNHLSIY